MLQNVIKFGNAIQTVYSHYINYIQTNGGGFHNLPSMCSVETHVMNVLLLCKCLYMRIHCYKWFNFIV